MLLTTVDVTYQKIEHCFPKHLLATRLHARTQGGPHAPPDLKGHVTSREGPGAVKKHLVGVAGWCSFSSGLS